MQRPIVLVVAALAAAVSCSAGESVAPSASPSPDATAMPAVAPMPVQPLPWGPTPDEYAAAAQLVADMSVSQQAGQVLVARYASVDEATDLVVDLHLGGVIVFGDNVASTEQVRDDIAALQAAAGRPYPLVVGVDQEGGNVARIGAPATAFPSLMTMGAAKDPSLAERVARASGEELRALGFTMVYAPVADVTTGRDDPTIGSRSASSDPAIAAGVTSGAVRGYAESGIVATIKHFPGHGSVPADSHVQLPVQDAALDELRRRDLVPFRTAIGAGVPAVMVGHIDVTAIDPGVPSSLSAPVLGLLRDELGFDGLVVTDALDMAAVTGGFGTGDATVRSLAAGVDLVLMPPDVRAAHAAIVEAVADGTLPAARLAEAATRGVALMVHQAAGVGPPPAEVVGSHGVLSYEASLAGLTVVSGACTGALVGPSIQITGGTRADRTLLAEAAEAAGLEIGSGEVVRLLAGTSPGSGDVVVALDTPYGLSESTAASGRIALYGRTPGAFRALVAVLTGAASGGGTLPVEVPGADRRGCTLGP
ncbi:MAG TPA: glycoside hydrolase family 3 protein [Jiangellaceae bacterium]|nr:glycoside hydrolase family 3 protein [Jiangellaceae bacterium]